ncbi:MAG: cyanophycin synthetase [Myxococcota bacterium]|nr:cyanophycin synthetase [Myxococcota bacterium]
MTTSNRLTYCQFLDAIYARTRVGEKFDLDGPKALEKAIGHPLQTYPSILVGGTNGKGSTCAFLEVLLREQGLKTGLFTSPHLISFTERIRISGMPIDPDWLTRDGLEILRIGERLGASFFETTWALAARAFQDFKVDVAIWEVGLGGRLDATNVAQPVASGISSIGLDHVHVLGDTLTAIAREKAAIFRMDRPAFTSATGAGLTALLEVAPPHLQVVQPTDDIPDLPLAGAHQRQNAALALALARRFSPAVQGPSLTKAKWPARVERLQNFILDCAHNPSAIQALGRWLATQSLGPVDVVFGSMQGKDVAAMAKNIEAWASRVTVVAPQYPRRLDPAEIAPRFTTRPVRIIPQVADALTASDPDRLTVICGSGFLAGEARAILVGATYPECGLVTTAR